VFDFVAFAHPSEDLQTKTISEATTVVMLNRGDQSVDFALYDEKTHRQVTFEGPECSLNLP
jgi:hypothetical protein